MTTVFASATARFASSGGTGPPDRRLTGRRRLRASVCRSFEGTIRVDAETHARLLELSNAQGTSPIETVRDATEALRQQRFAHQVAAELNRGSPALLLATHPT